MSKPERNYAVGLIVLALLFFVSIRDFLILIWKPWRPGFENLTGLLWFVVFVCAIYFVMTIAAIWIFFGRPEWAGIALTAANIMLCLYFPVGTAYAIYYFRKVRYYVDVSDNNTSAPATVS